MGDYYLTKPAVFRPTGAVVPYIVPASVDFPESADTLVESDGVGDVDVEVAIFVAIIASP